MKLLLKGFPDETFVFDANAWVDAKIHAFGTDTKTVMYQMKGGGELRNITLRQRCVAAWNKYTHNVLKDFRRHIQELMSEQEWHAAEALAIAAEVFKHSRAERWKEIDARLTVLGFPPKRRKARRD